MTASAVPARRGVGDRLRAPEGRLATLAALALAGCDGAVRGAMAAFALYLVSSIAAAALVLAWSAVTGRLPRYAGAGDLPAMLGAGLPIAFVTGRAVTLAGVAVARLPLRRAAIRTAVAGAPLLAALYLVAIPVTHLPVAMLAEAAVVGSWVLGALLPLRTLHAPRARILIMLGILLGLVMAFTAASTGGYVDGPDVDYPDRDLSRIGATPPESWETPGWEIRGGDGDLEVTVTDYGGRPLTDARVELWAALPREGGTFADDRVGELDPSVAGPVKAEPIAAGRPIRFRYDDVRDLVEGVVVITYVRDGVRYTAREHAVVAAYRATIAEWLGSFAPGSPHAVHRVAP